MFFGWLRSQPRCPIDTSTRQWIDRRWAWLENQFGVARVRGARVVLPRQDFFPDPYHGAESDVRPMLDRVCGYMGLQPVKVELFLYHDTPHIRHRKENNTTANRHELEHGRYTVGVETSCLADPLALVATLAREIGNIQLVDQHKISPTTEDRAHLTDLLTVFLGLGVFTANSVLREKYWQEGHFGGWSMGRRGALPMPAFGYALARFAQARGENGADWAKYLRLDVRAPFRQSLRYLDNEAFMGQM